MAGLEVMFALFVGSYSVAAHSSLRRAVSGLAIMAPGAVTWVLTSRGIGNGLLVIHQGVIAGQPRNAGVFLVGEVLACWLLGVFVRARRQAAALAGRNAALERQAEQAVAAERARIARELHDIVAHHLSVVVLQAAGAQASGRPATGALQKIEHSGRQALTEMRRLLGVLRESPDETGLTPQPGVGELAALAESVRAAGLPVRLVVDADHAALPTAVGVSAYRIVQEALTNVLKHAGQAHAEVAIGCADGAVTIEVTDDGAGIPADGRPAARCRAGRDWPECASGRRFSAASWPPGRGPGAVTRCAPSSHSTGRPPSPVISVLIVDDQDLVREGLRMLLEAEPDLRVAGEAGNGSQALAQARRLDPDVVLMDVRMPEMDGIEATAQACRGAALGRGS